MLTAFKTKGYRQLDVDDLRLGKINVLVGPNSSGKTSLIQALHFATDLLAPSRSADQLIVSTHSSDLLDGFTKDFREGRGAEAWRLVVLISRRRGGPRRPHRRRTTVARGRTRAGGTCRSGGG